MQEWVAYLVVGIASLFLLKWFFFFAIAPGLSRWFLKKGKVELAMKLRQNRSGCENCGHK
ncbi:MAG: hypothetical protein HY843_05735 [Bdellovibrio sp.]|nr:hypothetical protein [Bdellovibrio sp.]